MSSKHSIIRLRRGTAAEWAASEPQPGGEVLKLGEPGWEKDTGKLKIGDGTTPWNSLAYFADGVSLTIEDIQDNLYESFLIAGTGIAFVYDDGNDTLTINSTGGGGGNPFDQDLNTFNIPTFDNVIVSGTKIFGGGDNSGDGNGYGTIELVPDSGLYGGDQYLIIDPTGPNHVHLRAGATIDNSAAELILGGENSYVKIGAGENPPVQISANDYNWTFNTAGEFVGHNGATIGTNGEGALAFYNTGNSNAVAIVNRNIDSGANLALMSVMPSASGGLATVSVVTSGGSYEYWDFKDNGILELASSGLQFSDGTIQNTAASGIINDALNTSLIASTGIVLSYDGIAETLAIGISGDYIESQISTLLVGGSGIDLSYNSGLDSLTISATGLALSNHNHISSNITDFSSAVSGLLPVKDIVSGTNISITSVSGVYTINSTAVTSVDQAASVVTTVFNKTGSPIPKMTAVYIDGGQGDQPTVALAVASGEMTSSKTYGITYEAISNMSTGRVVVIGALTGLNTDQFNPAPTGDVNGTTLWLSPTTPGGITTTKPSAPNHTVAVGTIVRTHQNAGVIEVKIQNGYELEELHNVAISGVTNGQFLQYNSSSQLWVPSSSGNFSTLHVTGDFAIDNIKIDANTISSTNSNGNIVLAPSGTGDVQVDADTLRVGDSNSAATITTNGTGNLTISTNSGTNSGSIVINQGSNANIAITPNGTGEVDLSKVDIDGGSIDGTAIGATSASTGKFTQLYPTVVDNGNVSGSVGTDVSTGQIFDMTVTGSTTLSNPTNAVNGLTVRWRITQDGTGGHSVSLDTEFQIPSSASSPLPWSTAADATDILAATYHAGRGKWDIVAFVPGY